MDWVTRKSLPIIGIFALSLVLAACQPQGQQAGTSAAPQGTPGGGNFFDQLGNAIKQGVQNGVDNGIETSGSVGVLGYAMMPSKLANNTLQPAYCLENPVTHKVTTVAPMFGRPVMRADGTYGFAQTTKQVSEHTGKIEVNLNGVLPGQTCADLISSGKLTPGIAPDAYYYNGGYSGNAYYR